MEQTTLPIPPDVFWPIVYSVGFVLAVLLILVLMPKTTDDPSRAQRWIEAFKKDLDLKRIKTPLVVLGLFFWALLTATLVLGLLWQISSLAFRFSFESADPAQQDWELRGRLIAITALTATLGAVIALPLTLRRLKLTRQQTRISEETLFNEKITEATRNLYTQRQVTRDTDDPKTRHDAWEDDIIRRTVAVDQLERLVEERPETALDIARVLTVYVREISKARFQLQLEAPRNLNPKERQKWYRLRSPYRSDLEKAVQTLGRLRMSGSKVGRDVRVNLRFAYLRGMDLKNLNFDTADFTGAYLEGANLNGAFLSYANFFGARLQGAYLSRANLCNARLTNSELLGTDFLAAHLQGADLENVSVDAESDFSFANFRGARIVDSDFSKVALSQSQLTELFADDSVQFAPQLELPERLTIASNSLLSDTPWRTWQKEIGFDPEDPSTW